LTKNNKDGATQGRGGEGWAKFSEIPNTKEVNRSRDPAKKEWGTRRKSGSQRNNL